MTIPIAPIFGSSPHRRWQAKHASV